MQITQIELKKNLHKTQKTYNNRTLCSGISNHKSDLKLHNLRLYPIHYMFETMFTLEIVSN